MYDYDKKLTKLIAIVQLHYIKKWKIMKPPIELRVPPIKQYGGLILTICIVLANLKMMVCNKHHRV